MMHLNRLLGTGILSRAAGRFLILLTVLMILGSFAAAFGEEGFSINNVSQATDAELEDALQQIIAEQHRRLKVRIVLNPSEISTVKGKTEKITASIEDLPEGVTAGRFVWSVDHPEVAAVQNGSVKAVNSGTTAVHCSAVLSNGMEIRADCRVSVIIPVSGIKYSKDPVKMQVGETYTPSFSFIPEDATNTAMVFETSDAAVATVENGTITARAAGSARITATTVDGSNKQAVISIKVIRTFSAEPVAFNSRFMRSVSSQIHGIQELTLNGSNRAGLAAFLILEYMYQCPDREIDYRKPVYVSEIGSMAAVVFAVKGDYVMVTYQPDPLSTGYIYLGDSNEAVAKEALEAVSDQVWLIPVKDYTQKLELLIQQTS